MFNHISVFLGNIKILWQSLDQISKVIQQTPAMPTEAEYAEQLRESQAQLALLRHKVALRA